jgi:uncharacterized protein YbjT (DUF2867 family)
MIMYAITGITGKVGGAVAKTLIAGGQEVRAVLRNPEKAKAWEASGCAVAIADVRDDKALEQAFSGADGVFVMLPPNFDPSPDFSETHEIITAIKSAIAATQPKKVVALSTIGAQAHQPSLLSQLGNFEKQLKQLSVPVAFVRAAWFMENAVWDIAPARENGIVPAFLQPLDRKIPMVATADIGHVIAATLREEWHGYRTIELEGSVRVSPDDIASTFSKLLARDVQAQPVPRDTWESLFRSHGMQNPFPRIQMLDGFNEGWLSFEGSGTETRVGKVALETVLRQLVEQAK